MKPFWKVVFGGCLGSLVAFILINLIIFGILGSAISSLTKGSDSQPSVPKNAILRIDFSNPIQERNTESFSFSPISFSADMGESISLLDAIRALDAAATDPQIRFAYIKPDDMAMGVAHIEEFRAALERFRASGKPVVVYCQNLTAGKYYLCSVADKLILNAYGDVNIAGMSSQLMYYKDLIDKLGIDVQLIRHGKYKSAGEPYIKSEMSPENREQYEKLLGSIWKTIAETCAGSRDFTEEQLNEWIDNLVISSPEVAKEKGLVDELWYDDQVRDYFCTLCGVKESKDLKYISLKDYAKARVHENMRSKNKIALIYADGEIVMNDSEGNIGNNFAKVIAEVREDPQVKAVVFRVNSPGGSVQASAAIEREIKMLKEKGIPVIASYSEYAASGGYWISCASDKIFSDKTTLTGSIGVFGLVPSFSKALKKNVYLNVYEVATHKHGGHVNGMFPLDPEEEAVMQEQIDHTYNDFVSRVCAGRGLEFDAVDAIAQGRVWAGTDAIGIGLVDELGGLTDAIDYAASAVSLDNYRLVEYPEVKPMMERMMSSMNDGETDQDVRIQSAADVFTLAGNWLLNLNGPQVVSRMPVITIVLD
ncbi:MAG: signal peptide peptidase SppA [Bacteroidales bacterium]|nr:signal peptide peptidase SppA [Bacteroidales bacterium]